MPTILDLSGGAIKFVISDGQHSHQQKIHVAPFNPSTGQYSASFEDGEAGTNDTAGLWIAKVSEILDPAYSITYVGAFLVVAGTISPIPSPVPAPSPSTRPGVGTGADPSSAAELTITAHDDAGNLVKYVFGGLAGNAFLPNSKLAGNGFRSGTTGLDDLINYILGTDHTGAALDNALRSHAGGNVQGPYSATWTLNKKWRRKYNLT